MLIFKIILIALCSAFASLILKSIKPELSIITVLSGGVLILLLTVSSLGQVFSEIVGIMSSSGVSSDTLKMLLKIVGVGFMCEIASGICSDIGANNLAEYMLIGGRIAIIAICFPVVKNLISIVSGLV